MVKFIIGLFLLSFQVYSATERILIFDKAYSTDFNKEFTIPNKSDNYGLLFKTFVGTQWLDFGYGDNLLSFFCSKDGIDFWTNNLISGTLDCNETINNIKVYTITLNNGYGNLISKEIQLSNQLNYYKLELYYKFNDFETTSFTIERKGIDNNWYPVNTIQLKFTGMTFRKISIIFGGLGLPSYLIRFKINTQSASNSILKIGKISIKENTEIDENFVTLNQSNYCYGELTQGIEKIIDIIDLEKNWINISSNTITLSAGAYKISADINVYPEYDSGTTIYFKLDNVSSPVTPITISQDKIYSYNSTVPSKLVINTMVSQIDNTPYQFKIYADNNLYIYAPNSGLFGNCAKITIQKIE